MKLNRLSSSFILALLIAAVTPALAFVQTRARRVTDAPVRQLDVGHSKRETLRPLSVALIPGGPITRLAEVLNNSPTPSTRATSRATPRSRSQSSGPESRTSSTKILDLARVIERISESLAQTRARVLRVVADVRAGHRRPRRVSSPPA